MPSMIAIVHSIYSKSVHAPDAHAGLMDNESERYCTSTVLKTVIMRGWPRSYNDVPKEAQPYYSFRDELTVVNDIILNPCSHTTQHNYIRDTLVLMQLNVVQMNACIGIRCIHN